MTETETEQFVLLDTSRTLPPNYDDRAVPRVKADPLDLHGLPRERYHLDALLTDLCRRLVSAGGVGMTGQRLVAELLLDDSRALRALVSYGHVWHRLRQIIGVPGVGYVWGPCRPGAYKSMGKHCRQMGRCWFFLSALYSKETPQVQAAQLLLDFVGTDQPPGQSDELTVLMQSHGVTLDRMLDSLVEMVQQTDAGKATLRRMGDRHAQVLLPADRFADLAVQVEKLYRDLRSLLAGAGADRGEQSAAETTVNAGSNPPSKPA
jgi:hypothetical protein